LVRRKAGDEVVGAVVDEEEEEEEEEDEEGHCAVPHRTKIGCTGTWTEVALPAPRYVMLSLAAG